MKINRFSQKTIGRTIRQAVMVLLIAVLFQSDIYPEDDTHKQLPPLPKPEQEFRRMLPKKAPKGDMLFIGKAVCSLKRTINMPFSGVISSLEVNTGQEVHQGDIMARYDLAPEVRPQQSLQKATNEILQTKKEPNIISTHLRDSGYMQAGSPAEPGVIPQEAVIVAPIDGHVVWMNPEFRVGAEIKSGSQVFILGIMDPMLLRANIYEEEALRLAVGDRVRVYPESLPWKTYRARVSRIAWTPLSLDPVQPSYYEVEFIVPNKELLLREGLRVIIHLFKPLKRAQQLRMGGKQDDPD